MQTVSSRRLNLLFAIQRARAAGFLSLADALTVLLRQDGRLQREAFGVLHPMRADREAFSNVESPKLEIA